MQIKKCVFTVRTEVRVAAQEADKALRMACQRQASYDDSVWLKLNGSKEQAEKLKTLQAIHGKKGAFKAGENGLYEASLGGLFPLPLRNVIFDLADQISTKLEAAQNVVNLGVAFRNFFGKGDVRIWFSAEPYAFVDPEKLEWEEKVRSAFQKFVRAIEVFLCHEVVVTEDLSVTIDSVPVCELRHNGGLKESILLLARHFPCFKSKAFAEAYRKTTGTDSNVCDDQRRRLKHKMPAMEWISNKGSRTVEGLTVRFEGSKENILSAIDKRLLQFRMER